MRLSPAMTVRHRRRPMRWPRPDSKTSPAGAPSTVPAPPPAPAAAPSAAALPRRPTVPALVAPVCGAASLAASPRRSAVPPAPPMSGVARLETPPRPPRQLGGTTAAAVPSLRLPTAAPLPAAWPAVERPLWPARAAVLGRAQWWPLHSHWGPAAVPVATAQALAAARPAPAAPAVEGGARWPLGGPRGRGRPPPSLTPLQPHVRVLAALLPVAPRPVVPRPRL